MTPPVDTAFQLQDNHGTWHAALIGPGILCRTRVRVSDYVELAIAADTRRHQLTARQAVVGAVDQVGAVVPPNGVGRMTSGGFDQQPTRPRKEPAMTRPRVHLDATAPSSVRMSGYTTPEATVTLAFDHGDTQAATEALRYAVDRALDQLRQIEGDLIDGWFTGSRSAIEGVGGHPK